MKKLLLLFFLLCLPYKAFAGFVDAINCDDIPLAQRNTNALICLQSTTAGGRSPGIGYLWNGTVWIQYSNIPRVAVAALPAGVPKTGDVVVVTDALNSATCIVAGGIAANICQWDGAAWSPIGGGGGGSGHLFKDETIDLVNQPLSYINCTGGGIACTSNVGTNSVDITVTAGAEADPVVGAITGVVKADGAGNIAAANATDLPYTPAGDIAANTVGGAIAELDKEKQPLDADLTALAGNVTAGFWAAATNVPRSMATASANNITITNPAGVAGNPTWDVGPNVALTTRSFTPGNFDYDFGAAASFSFPRATGAAPTTPGRCAYDTTASPQGRYKCGLNNGSTITLPSLAEVQPLNANLTALAGLTPTGTEARVPYVDSAGVWHYWQRVLCVNSGGNVTHTSNLAPLTETCDASGSGLSGATNNQALFATAATTFASSSALTKTAGGVIQMPNGQEIGDCATDCILHDTTAYAAHGQYSLVWPYVGASASVGMTTGARTNGNVVVFNATGAMVAGGAAGTGDATNTSVKDFTNLTLDVEGTGNDITTTAKIWLPAAGGSAASPSLMWDVLASNAPTPVCSAGGTETTMLRCTADFPDSDGDYSLQQSIMLPVGWTGAIDAVIKYRTTATSGNTVWQIATACRADGEVDDVAFNTADAFTADAAKGTTNQLNDAAKTGLTTTGCAAGELMHIKVLRNRTHGSDTIAGVVSLVGVELTTRRVQ